MCVAAGLERLFNHSYSMTRANWIPKELVDPIQISDTTVPGGIFNDERAYELAVALQRGCGKRLVSLTLDVSHLNAASLGARTLSSSLEHLNLQRFALQSNTYQADDRLSSLFLQHIVTNRNLEELCIKSLCVGADLASCIESCSNLTTLRVERCRAPFWKSQFKICRALSRSNIKSVDLNDISRSTLGLTLLKAVQNSEHFRTLELRNFDDDNESLGDIRDFFLKCDKLHDLYLSQSGFHPQRSFEGLLEGIGLSRSLQRLTIEMTEISLRGARALGGFLRSDGPLRELKLEHNAVSNESLELMLSGLHDNKHLRVLSLSSCLERTDQCGRLVRDLLRYNSYIGDLNLCWNGLTDEKFLEISEGLCENQSVTRLSVAGNGLSDLSCIALANALRGNRSVVFLDLSCNEIVNLGEIAEVISERTLPLGLKLDQCPINDEGLNALVDVLEEQGQLTFLELDQYAEVSSECILRLINTVMANSQLVQLKLGCRQLDDRSFTGLVAAMPSFRNLKSLSFGWRRDGSWGKWTEFLAALKENLSLTSLKIVHPAYTKKRRNEVEVYTQRNFVRHEFETLRAQVVRSLNHSTKGVWPTMTLRLTRWPVVAAGMSALMDAIKTEPRLIELVGFGTKRLRDSTTEEDADVDFFL